MGESGRENAIAIIGLAGKFPGARTLDEFWRNVRDGVESVATLTDDELRRAGVPEDVLKSADYVRAGVGLDGFDRFDAGFFGFSPRDADIMDPQHRVFLECAWEALEHAGHDPARFRGSVGVFAGCGMNAYMMYHLLPNRALMDDAGLFLVRHAGNDKDFLATRVSYELDLKGPSINVQTACSTSLVAVHVAAQHLLSGECDMALAGGVTIELPHRTGYVYKENEILSRDGHCRPFDADASGTIFGSGAGIVVLRRLQDAIDDGDQIHAVILGSAVNNDGASKIGYLAPGVDGQAAAIAEAISVANVEPESVTYVETHGTGTHVGDPIEIAALTEAFRGCGAKESAFCAIGSLKANIGHLDTAAGVAGLIKTVLALKHRQIPPSLHFRSANPAIDFPSTPFFVNADLAEWKSTGARRAGVSSLGVGGTNAHVVLEEAPLVAAPGPARAWQLIPLSAKTPGALDTQRANVADHLRDTTDSIADIAWTLQVGRQAHTHRRFVVARDANDAAATLEGMDPLRVVSGVAPRTTPSLAFMFAGGGAQHINMARELYRNESVFRDAVHECFGILRAHVPEDLAAILFPTADAEKHARLEVERPSVALPLLFTIQYAQSRLWRSWGIEPDAMIGHSMGEYTAACLSGVFTLADALAVVALRGRLFETLAPGGMVSVSAGADDIAPLLPAALSIAAVNAPNLCVVSGPVRELEHFHQSLGLRDIEAQRLHISVAAHSSQVEPILAEFKSYLSTLRLGRPTIPFVSNLTGTWVQNEVCQPDYWVRHLRETVQFSQGLRLLLGDSNRLLLEVGPGRTLATVARLHEATPSQRIFTSLPRSADDSDDAYHMLHAAGQLWVRGRTVDWPGMHGGETRRRVVLPTYPFERQRHWIDAPRAADVHADVPAGRSEDVKDWMFEPLWRRTPLTRNEDTRSVRPGVIVFDGRDAAGIAAQATALLRESGERVVSVIPGDRFERLAGDSYAIRAGSVDDARELIRAFEADGGVPGRVLHLWTVGAPSDVQRDRELGLESILSLVRAIGAEDIAGGTFIVVGTSGSLQVAGEAVPSPARAMSCAALRVIASEFTGITSRVIDLAADAHVTGVRGIARRLCDELAATGGNDLVAIRGRERFARHFERRQLTPGESLLRDRGVYLITGGLGGIGRVLASELAARFHARLALVSRVPLPPRADWAMWVATHAVDDDIATRIRFVTELESAGGEVVVVAGDLSNPRDAARMVGEARSRFGLIHGVIHAAGVLDDALLQTRERMDRDRVLAPKVDGTIALESALESSDLDFFVSFSSVSTFAGIPGQTDYAAANAFLDAHAQQRAARSAGRTMSIAWSAWKDVGMIARLSGEKTPSSPPADRSRGMSHPMLHGVTREGEKEIFTATLSAESDWVLREHQLQSGNAVMPGTGYLEIVRAAVESQPQRRLTELRDVFFLSPFAVPSGDKRDLRVELSATATANTFDFAVLGRAHRDEAWEQHVRGTAVVNGVAPSGLLPTAEIRARGERSATGVPPHPFLQFGPRWSNVEGVVYGARNALVTLGLPAEYHGDLDQVRLHPAILDMATASGQSLLESHDAARSAFIPLGYDAIRIAGPLPARVVSHVVARDNDRGDLAVFDIAIAGDDGRIIVDINGFTMKRVAADALVAERARAPGRAQVNLDDAISPVEGAAAFLHLMTHDAPAHIVVSPGPLDSLVPRTQQHNASAAAPASGREDQELTRDLARSAAALASHDAVADAVVVAKNDRGRERRLVGYVKFRQGRTATVSELRRTAKAVLPPDLVPANIIEMETFPVSSTGAIDREKLPDPFAPADTHVAPRTNAEKTIAGIWSELLGVERVGIHDNFFDIGGHSLLSVRVITRVDKVLGVRLDQAIMVLQTLEQIAARCEQHNNSRAALAH